MTETVIELLQAFRAGAMKPRDAVARTYERIRRHADPAIFISLRPEAAVANEAKQLEARRDSNLPLFGIPVAVKDNIDVKGLPTTAGCPAYAYRPKQDATVVARLRQAGALIVGKTNLDQFATGLVGVRSPYGVPGNPHRKDLIPGGSSSGSAVAVAAGLVPLALGTDTAGSGRVPAGLNNIVGLKASLGVLPNAGVVPACRSLDCVSVFSLTADDAWLALMTMAGIDQHDPYTRDLPLGSLGHLSPMTRIGVPKKSGRYFFGDKESRKSYEAAINRVASLGMQVSEIEFSPFFEVAKLLYEGPWVAERYAAVGEFIARNARQVHPVTRKIILSGKKPSAVDVFRAFYRLAELRAKIHSIITDLDALMVPTLPATYTVAQVRADPVRLNSKLGTYTNFVNLLGFCGIAVPASIAADDVPYGVTFLARDGEDALVTSIGRLFHSATGRKLGALDVPQPQSSPEVSAVADGEIALAVVGAHMSGMPLNRELKEIGARFIEATKTAPIYRLYQLTGPQPHRPGMLRTTNGSGAAIEIELWALPKKSFGQFVAAVAPPLSIGTVSLADGRAVKGFLVESQVVMHAEDITRFRGWRSYMEAREHSSQ